MRKIITYIADDGAIFNNEEECVAYESGLQTRFQIIKDNVLPFNENGSILCFYNEDDFMTIYETISYLIITKDIPSDSIQFIEDRGYCKIPTEKGIYHYNNASWEWDNFLIWEPIKEYIKEYY